MTAVKAVVTVHAGAIALAAHHHLVVLAFQVIDGAVRRLAAIGASAKLQQDQGCKSGEGSKRHRPLLCSKHFSRSRG